MKTNYESPHIEVINIEVEDVLCTSGVLDDFNDGGSAF